ncbi:MAG: LysR substrate-binding domain-containing protein [Burkholderiaceae bacterium]
MKLPPLNALRAFEAVGRLGGVKQAAAELSVTPAAVSQQVRLLEDFLGLRLFDRLPRELRLTDSGIEYQRQVSRHLRGIAEATERVRPRPHAVALSVVPSFATLWLSPRLAAFVREAPHIAIRVEADPRLVDLGAAGDFDLAIREGTGRYRRTDVHPLFPVALLPVASPSYVRSLTTRAGFDWARARLLFEEDQQGWERWFEFTGRPLLPTRTMLFSHGMMALAAAAEGEGVVLASWCLVEHMIGSGRLVVVEQQAMPTGRHYWLAWPSPEARGLSPAAVRFRDWLIAQAQASQERHAAALAATESAPAASASAASASAKSASAASVSAGFVPAKSASAASASAGSASAGSAPAGRRTARRRAKDRPAGS